MDACPICSKPLNATDRTCECGEVLQPWRTIEYYGTVLRNRGLALMEQGDTLGACLSFFQAMLSNPIDGAVTTDMIRSLILLDRFGEARLLLETFRTRLGEDLADSLSEAISQREEARFQRATDEAVAQETAPPKITRKPLGVPPLPVHVPLRDRIFRRRRMEDDLWLRVLQSESRWDGNWTVLADWIDATAEEHLDMGLDAYVAGLGQFCEGDDEAACRSFEKAIMANPPFLNAAVYFTYLAIDQTPASPDRWHPLRDRLGEEEIQFICDIVPKILDAPLNANQRQNLDYLMGRVAPAAPPPPPPVTGTNDAPTSAPPKDQPQASPPEEQVSTKAPESTEDTCPAPPVVAENRAEGEPQPPSETE
jgi:hypothetical protein